MAIRRIEVFLSEYCHKHGMSNTDTDGTDLQLII